MKKITDTYDEHRSVLCGLNEKANDLAAALMVELGEQGDSSDLITNHRTEDWHAAANGDVAALVSIRTACGLPVVA